MRRPFKPPRMVVCCSSEDEGEENRELCEEEYEVEAITDTMTSEDGKVLYLVKWQGWPAEASTWQSESQLLADGCGESVQAFLQSRQSPAAPRARSKKAGHRSKKARRQ